MNLTFDTLQPDINFFNSYNYKKKEKYTYVKLIFVKEKIEYEQL